MVTVTEVRNVLIQHKRKFTVAAGSEGPTVYYDPSLDVAQLRTLVNDKDVTFKRRGPTEIVTTLPLLKKQWV